MLDPKEAPCKTCSLDYQMKHSFHLHEGTLISERLKCYQCGVNTFRDFVYCSGPAKGFWIHEPFSEATKLRVEMEADGKEKIVIHTN